MRKPQDLKTLWQLFATFFKIGLFTFGGGYAMISVIQRETTEKHHWVTDKDILDIIAIAESTPGPIAVNSATFVGYQVAGVLGSACATLGLVLPSFCIILLLSYVLGAVEMVAAVRWAFTGIRACVLALIIKAFVTLAKQCPKNVLSYIILALAFCVSLLVDIDTVFIIIACALIGLGATLLSRKAGEKK